MGSMGRLCSTALVGDHAPAGVQRASPNFLLRSGQLVSQLHPLSLAWSPDVRTSTVRAAFLCLAHEDSSASCTGEHSSRSSSPVFDSEDKDGGVWGLHLPIDLACFVFGFGQGSPCF